MTDVRIVWGSGGHELEHVVLVNRSLTQFFDSFDYLINEVAYDLKDALPEGFVVSDRGSRIEIVPPKAAWIDRDRSIITDEAHEQVKAAVIGVFGDNVTMTIMSCA